MTKQAGMRFGLAVTSCLLLMCSVSIAYANKRVALVIGNSAYKSAPALINPKNDAYDINNSLRELGFSTIVATDLDRAGMNDALDRFSRTVGSAEIALVYYSGHGMQFAGKNFLLPVDARLQDSEDVNRFRLTPLEDVFSVLQGAPGARIVILDACRNNPVEDDLKRRLASIPGANRDAFLTRGFSRVEANGLIVAYATQANDVAADGKGRNSPFATAFLNHLGTPDIDLRQMLFNVQDEVDRLTGGKQRPELSISLVGQFKLKVTVPGRDNQEQANKERNNKEVVAPPPVDPAAQAWAVTRETTSQAVLEEFIRQFGSTVYGSMARARLEELKKSQVAAIPPPVHVAPLPLTAPVTPPVPPMGDVLGDRETTFDGLWEFTLAGGPRCRIKSMKFPRRITKGVITTGDGRRLGVVAKDGSYRLTHPAPMNRNFTVEEKGKLRGEIGESTYVAVGTPCQGSYKIRRLTQG
jgi:uncharacterized caspase-like protein